MSVIKSHIHIHFLLYLKLIENCPFRLPKSLYVFIFIIDILPCDVNYLCMTFNHFKSYYDLNKTIEYFDMGYI